MVHMTRPRPFQVWYAICGLALTTINLSIKFEVSMSNHYKKDMKGDKDVDNQVVMGHLRSLE